MVLAAAADLGCDVDPGTRTAMVRRHRASLWRRVLYLVSRGRPFQQGGLATGIARRAARLLPRHLLADVLAGSRARGPCGSAGVVRATPAHDSISAGLAGPVVDRVRARDHQAAALCAAALSGDCDPHRWRARTANADAQGVADARLVMVVFCP